MIWYPEIEFPFKNFLRMFEKKPAPIPEPEPQPVIVETIEESKKVLQIGKDFSIDPTEWANAGDRDAILASSGFGKSYLAGVMTEEIIESGGQVVIIDPEGENYTLAERYPIIIVGGDHKTVDIDLDKCTREDMDRLIKKVARLGISVILDLSERTPTRQQELFTMFGSSLFTAQDKQENRRPIKFIVEEARVFAPQSSKGLPSIDGETCFDVFHNIATRGRKRGINMLLATQRPASIHKDILSQCNRWWFGGMQSTQDCKALMPYLAEAGITEEEIKSLQPGAGEFFFYANGKTAKIKSRTRKCKHGGATPTIQTNSRVASRADVAAAIKSLNDECN